MRNGFFMRCCALMFPRWGVFTAVALVVGGCAVQESRTVVQQPLPEKWLSTAGPVSVTPLASAVSADPAAPVPAQWWQSFGSTQLEALVQEAWAGSSTLRIAQERVRQAEIALQTTDAAQLPSASLSAGTSGSRSEGAATRKSSSLGLSASYEADLWGRLAAGSESARAAAAASRYDLATSRITLSASVASSYFQLLALRERVEIARSSLATAERVLRIVESRARNGVATPLEVSQQTITVLQQRTALQPLEEQVRQTRTALALLLGRQPVGFDVADGESFMGLAVPAVSPGMPSDLLTRRPDLQAAEARLRAADADVAAARAALLPSLSLSASSGLSSAVLLGLGGGTTSASLAASLAQTLFDGGRKNLQIETVQSQRVVLVETYASAVRTALKEVQDGLGNAETTQRQEDTQAQVVAQAQRSLDLSERRYREGLDTLLTVLEAQRTLFSARDSLSQIRLSRLQAALDLYRVLGGGWQPT